MSSRPASQSTHDTNLPSSGFEALAAFSKAVSEPLRLETLRVLRNNSFGVLELCHILDVKQSALSHHLKVLAQANLVSTRREGNSIFYHRHGWHNESAIHPLQQALFDYIDDLTLDKATQARIKFVQKERAARSKDFFRQQSDSFERQQERIATYAVYGESAIELLLSVNLKKNQTAMEVGPGNGEFLSHLATHFKKVIALDNAKEMLSRAKQHCKTQQLNNVQFIHGDTEHAVSKNMQVDCVVANMVLHHMPSPAELFDDAFQLLRPHGVLLITEICSHQQDWAKQACGDLWLGFEPDEITQWGQRAGFSVQQSVYQALRNGFQIQLHCFSKNNC